MTPRWPEVFALLDRSCRGRGFDATRYIAEQRAYYALPRWWRWLNYVAWAVGGERVMG